MKNEILINHLKNVNLSFLNIFNDNNTIQQKTLIDPQPEPLQKVEVKRKNIVRYTSENNNSWNDKIRELEAFFENIELPTQPIKVNAYSTILDCSLFIESHIETVKANKGNKTFLPYLHRLQEFKNTLSENII